MNVDITFPVDKKEWFFKRFENVFAISLNHVRMNLKQLKEL